METERILRDLREIDGATIKTFAATILSLRTQRDKLVEALEEGLEWVSIFKSAKRCDSCDLEKATVIDAVRRVDRKDAREWSGRAKAAILKAKGGT